MGFRTETVRPRVDQHSQARLHMVYLLRSKAKAKVSFIELT